MVYVWFRPFFGGGGVVVWRVYLGIWWFLGFRRLWYYPVYCDRITVLLFTLGF